MITVTAIYLYRKLNPQGVLMLAGLVMLTFALILNVQPIIPDKSTGSAVFDLVKVVEETFIGNLSRAGLMIMTIGGYVAFMNHIKATNALVHLSLIHISSTGVKITRANTWKTSFFRLWQTYGLSTEISALCRK